MKTNQKKQLRSIYNSCIAVLALFVSLVMFPTGLHAQWNPNTYVNLQISGLSDDDQQSIPTTDGKTWIAFYSLTAGNYNMMAQLLDANGNKLLGTDGVLVSSQTSGSAIFVFNVCIDASNNLIIACQDQRTSTMQAVVYKISESGVQLWNSTGVILGAGLSPYPTVLSTGETVVAWNESTSNTLKIQKISNGGALVWATPISVVVGSSKTTRGQLIANSNGKFTNVFQKRGVGISTTLYAQAYDSTGLTLYSPLQISNQTSSGSRYYSILAEVDTTYFGYFVSQGSRFNSFLQRINITGTKPWGMNGSNFNTSVGSSDNYQMVTDINMTPGTNYIWSVCNFCNTLQSQYGIYVQKFLKTTGARQFTDLAQMVYPISANFDQHVSRITLLTDGPMFMEYDVNYKIYAIRLNSTGDFVWPGNRVELSSTTATLSVPKMRYGFTPIGANRCAGVWTENRASGGYKGYAQGISLEGFTGIKVYTLGNVPATINTPMGTLQMLDTITPLTANQSVTWSIVPGTGVALISTSGLVTAITNGTVWAKAISVQDNTVKDSLLITMTNQNITVPTVITLAATSVAGTTAVLNGSVNANNASTAVTFNYGLTTAYGNTMTATPSPILGNTPTPVLANLVGLIPGTTYHFRASGTNVAGTTNGSDLTFTTPLIPPTVITNAATNVLNTTAQLNGTIVANNILTTVSFDWGPTTAYGNNTPATPVNVSGMTSTPVSANLSSLIWGTTYHYRCVGVNSVGTAYGTDMTFTTGCPVIPAPGAISGPASVCQLTVNVVYSVPVIPNATNYSWTVPTGVSIIAGLGTSSITVNFTSSAVSGNVTVTGTNNCTSGPTATLAVTVNSLPVPTITGTTILCAGSGYYTYTTQSGMTGYTWTISSGGSIYAGAGTSVITVVWNNTGAQTVSVNYSNAAGCQAQNPTVLNVTVNNVPGPAGSITGSYVVCGGATGVAYSVAAITGATTYVWTLPAGATIASGATTNSITVNFATNASSGNITVYGNNICGNGAVSPPFAVIVNALPGAAGTITGPASVCSCDIAIYTVPVIAGATGYTWTTPAGATIVGGSNSNSITVNFCPPAISGNVTVIGTNSCGSGTVSPNFAVTVNPIPPAPVVTNTGYTAVSSASSGNQWYYSATPGVTGTPISGAIDQTYDATQTGSGWYWSIVTLNGCSSDTSNHKLIITVGIGSHSSSAINIYPVPNDGRFNVSITTVSSESFSISVYNSLGVKIYEETMVDVNGSLQKMIDLRPVSSGVYSVIFENSQNQVVKKIIVNR